MTSPQTGRAPPSTALSRRRFCAGLGLAAALPALAPGWSLAQTADAAGPAVRALDFDWLDGRRQRAVPVRLYLPAETSARALPLAVFSHGIGGSRRGYSYLGRHWAAHGVASLHLQHVGSDRNLWMGNPLTLVGRLHGAAQETEALDRVHDLHFALDRVLDGAAGVAIDAQRVVAAGHSYGANTTLLAAGARVEREGRVLDLRDVRIRAAIVLSAPPFYGEADFARILATVTVPSLHITATEDVINIPGYFSDTKDRLRVFDATGGSRKWLAVFEGGSHSVFTDRSGTGGAVLNPLIKGATQELSTAFLKTVFEGDEQALKAWPQRHAKLLWRFTEPG